MHPGTDPGSARLFLFRKRAVKALLFFVNRVGDVGRNALITGNFFRRPQRMCI